MTDRLADLRQGRSASPTPSGDAYASGDADDIEVGLRAEQDAVLAKFNKEADAIDKVYVWADKSLRSITASLPDAANAAAVTAQLDVIEKKLDAVRKRLKRIAAENKALAAERAGVPSSLRIRVARYTKLGKDFMAVTARVEKAREQLKSAVENGVKRDIMHANPTVTEGEVERAMDGGQIDGVLRTQDAGMRHQVEDLRARNRDIQKLSKSIVELHQMFTDMSLLVEGQQELVNDIEYNVKEVKNDTKKAAGELVEARKHQKSARKKKVCICVLILIAVIGVAAAVLIPMALKNGWFTGGSDDDSASSTPAPAPASRSVDATRVLGRASATNFNLRWFV